jgi:succinyl-CoA synthetase alpha subunit
MLSKTIIKHNLYFDSVSLMKISAKVSGLPGVKDVLVGMGTDLNKELLQNMGLLNTEIEKAAVNDVMIGVLAETNEALETALAEIENSFNVKRKTSKSADVAKYQTIQQAVDSNEGFNLAVISTPGQYAVYECKIALRNNINVFLFSDNVSIEDEIQLKDLALEKGLLMMGPDCGTAIINGMPLGFANRIRRGNIGIAAASGTGLQHITTLIDHMGGGITQAIGTGGRDLSEKIGGRTMLAALDSLKDDPETKVVVILSKPPAFEVAKKVLTKAENLCKPVVLCLFGQDKLEGLKNINQCFDIEETAAKAVSLSLEKEIVFNNEYMKTETADHFLKTRLPEQKYVRGIFGGGTLCDEARITFRRSGVPFYSNIPFSENERLADIHQSVGNTFIDMGDDYFTTGKPHPMIDPSLRNKRIIQDALEKDTAAILLDFVLGHGSHPDPAGVALEAVTQAKTALKDREILWLASVVGAKDDPQNYHEQIRRLLSAGFIVSESNVRLARLAAFITGGSCGN